MESSGGVAEHLQESISQRRAEKNGQLLLFLS